MVVILIEIARKKNLKEEILDENSEVWLIGRMTENVDPKSISHNVNVFNSINQLVENI